MQSLSLNNQDEGLQFCDFGIIKIEENADWFLNTLFKDECHFQQSSHINKQNMCVCARGYPHKYSIQKIINNFHVRVKTGKKRNRRLLENFNNSLVVTLSGKLPVVPE